MKGRKKYPILMLLIMLTASLSFAQEGMKFHREVSVHNDTALIKAEIWMSAYTPKKLFSDVMYGWYYRQDIHFTQGNFTGQVLDGVYQHYDSEGHLLIKGKYEKGLKAEAWYYWSVNGRLLKQMTYEKGKLHGDYWLYDLNGSVLEHRMYEEGRLSGKLLKYKDGLLISETYYQHGEPQKMHFYKDGKRFKTEKLNEKKKPQKQERDRAKPAKKKKATEQKIKEKKLRQPKEKKERTPLIERLRLRSKEEK